MFKAGRVVPKYYVKQHDLTVEASSLRAKGTHLLGYELDGREVVIPVCLECVIYLLGFNHPFRQTIRLSVQDF